MYRIICGIVIGLAFFMAETQAIDLETMTIEKYEKMREIAKHSDVPLIAALQEGNIQEVHRLLGYGADVNIKDGAESTALLTAVQKGDKDVIQLLLEKGADVNTYSVELSYSVSGLNGNKEIKFYQGKGNTPLSLAIKARRADIVRLLLENGADKEVRYEHEMTALMLAAANKDLESVKVLLEFGADVSAKGEHGDSILIYALSDMDDSARNMIFTDMMKYEKNGKGELLMQLLSLDKDGFEQQVEINKQKFLTMAELLIDAGADVNARDIFMRTPLMIFSDFSAKIEAVKFLLEHGALVNLQDKNKKTALMYAAEYAGHEENQNVIKMLLEKGAKIDIEDEYGETALMIASRAENGQNVVKLFLANGATINKMAHQNSGGTALHNAYNFASNIYEDDKNVDTLLEYGANINIGDEQGFTILMEAVQNDDVAMVRKLLEKGADVNIQTTNFWGGTALMIAAEKGNEEIVRLLLKYGADINIRDNYKETALVLAVKKGYENIVRLLLEQGADVEGKSFYRETVLDCAKKKGNQQIIELLQSYEAK